MFAPAVWVARSMGVTLALPKFATKAVAPSGVIAIPAGLSPTAIGVPASCVPTSTGRDVGVVPVGDEDGPGRWCCGVGDHRRGEHGNAHEPGQHQAEDRDPATDSNHPVTTHDRFVQLTKGSSQQAHRAEELIGTPRCDLCRLRRPVGR